MTWTLGSKGRGDRTMQDRGRGWRAGTTRTTPCGAGDLDIGGGASKQGGMIIGIGSDLIDIRRVGKTLERFGERFAARCFTEVERRKSDRRKERDASYAKRFAAKEACAKALGTGLAKGVFWRDMGVVNLPGGKPTMRLTGGAAKRLKDITPPGHEAVVHLTITDDFPLAQAFVVIEALPGGPARGG